MENVREIVLDTLLALEKEDGFSSRLIKNVLDKYDYLERTRKAFIKRVTEGVIERRMELDYYLNAFSKTPTEKMKPLIRCLLRMSVYQLLYMDQIPDSAVCNEACKLAQKRGFGSLKGFVNGVLRTIAKNKEHLPLPDEQDADTYLSVKYSMPRPVLEVLRRAYQEEWTRELLEAFSQIAPVSVRFRKGLSESRREFYLQEAAKAGVKITKSPYLEEMFLLENVENLTKLEGFSEGAFSVQDASSALAVQALRLCGGETVIDACAAPGGKSMAAADCAAQVYAFDISEEKCSRIRENIQRMGIANVICQVCDATTPKEELFGKADALLLDVPCSGLGVMGKKRDIKYHFQPDDMSGLTALQRTIVEKSLAYVKPGGKILYSTCTVNPAENQEMASWIGGLSCIRPLSVTDRMPDVLRREREAVARRLSVTGGQELADNCVLFLPGMMNTDGFFFALFERTED